MVANWQIFTSTLRVTGETHNARSLHSALDLVAGLRGVHGVIKVAPDGFALASKALDEKRASLCGAMAAYCGNAADTIGEVWNLGGFLHGAIVGADCKLLLHQEGEDFLGTSIDTNASATHIGSEIERVLDQARKGS